MPTLKWPRQSPSRPYSIAGEIRVIFSRLSDRTRSRDQIAPERSRPFLHSCNCDRTPNAMLCSLSQLRAHFTPASKIDRKPTPVLDILGQNDRVAIPIAYRIAKTLTLQSLPFSFSLFFFVLRFSLFFFLCVCFPSFSKDFRGSAKRRTLALFGASLAFFFFFFKQGLEDRRNPTP